MLSSARAMSVAFLVGVGRFAMRKFNGGAAAGFVDAPV